MEPLEFDARERLMAVLSFCAYCDFVLLNPRKIYKDLKKLLHKVAKDQVIIWGPAIHKREIEIITESLKGLKETYREYFQESLLLRKLLDAVCERVQDKDYCQLRQMKQVPAEIMPGIKNPFVQAAFQHVFPYLKIFCEPKQGGKIFGGLWKKIKPLLDDTSLEKGEKLLLKNMIEAGFDLGLKGGSKISS